VNDIESLGSIKTGHFLTSWARINFLRNPAQRSYFIIQARCHVSNTVCILSIISNSLWNISV